MDKVSVIVPVYNTERYVEEALRSVMEQTLRSLEIIVIDDGSTDGSPQVLQRLAAEDNRIRIWSQPNRGLAAARNAGMEHMTGKYVYFMDSDDVLECDALECCYEKCEAEELDAVIFDAELFGDTEGAGHWFDYRRGGLLEDKVYRGADLLEKLIDLRRYRTPVWLNFMRRSLLEENSLTFLAGVQHEDELFTPQMFLMAVRMGRIDRTFFHRRIRPGSIMTSRFTDWDMDSYLRIVEELHRFVRGRDTQARRIVDKLTHRTLNAAFERAWVLAPRKRLAVFGQVWRRYPGCVSLNKQLLFLFKAPAKKMIGLWHR